MSEAPAGPITVELPRGEAAVDAELVDAFVSGKGDAAFIALVKRHQIPIYRRLSIALADPDDAEAVCEAVFVVASQRLSEWSRDTDFREWLFTVADETAASRKGEAPDADSPRLVDPAAYFRQSVHRALRSLDEEERAILVLSDLDQQPIEEIAARRDESVERVSEVLTRARARFTEALSTRAESAPRAVGPVHPKLGDVIDKRYLVEELLGEGGMAAVFRAQHLGLKRKVAVKTLHPTRQTQAMIRERFFREAEVLGRLAHPNFVDVSDFGESGRGMAYLVMELLEGSPLSSVLAQTGSLHPAAALRILIEICNGLAFAHGQGIIHRDIKPDNVVVLHGEPREGFAKILDLGIATTTEESGSEESTIYGTPAYMAPEQVAGGRIDGRVDLYAAGVLLFELLTGRVPFEGSTTEFILAQHITATPPRLADFASDLPEGPALQEIVDSCLEKDPNRRVKSAVALRDRAKAVLARLGDAPEGVTFDPTGAPTTSARAAARVDASDRLSVPVWLVIALVIVASAVALWWIFET